MKFVCIAGKYHSVGCFEQFFLLFSQEEGMTLSGTKVEKLPDKSKWIHVYFKKYGMTEYNVCLDAGDHFNKKEQARIIQYMEIELLKFLCNETPGTVFYFKEILNDFVEEFIK